VPVWRGRPNRLRDRDWGAELIFEQGSLVSTWQIGANSRCSGSLALDKNLRIPRSAGEIIQVEVQLGWDVIDSLAVFPTLHPIIPPVQETKRCDPRAENAPTMLLDSLWLELEVNRSGLKWYHSPDSWIGIFKVTASLSLKVEPPFLW
jgi:hypothetical protein